MRSSSLTIATFQKIIYDYYRDHARKLPWRADHDPYHVLVSEIMLQQTQVERVVAKYAQFISTFPDCASLARAPLREILTVWLGLGYNRRAFALKKSAEIIMTQFHGELPSSPELLMTLPGIGKTTASAIATFAFQVPTIFIETNTRAAFIHFFFPGSAVVKDTEIIPLVAKALDAANPRQWYYALMDYGAMLKKKHQNPGRRSAHYKKQSPFKGSNRYIRGMILRSLIQTPHLSEQDLVSNLGVEQKRIKEILDALQREGFITRQGKRLFVR